MMSKRAPGVRTTQIYRLAIWAAALTALPIMLACLGLVVQSALYPDRLPALFGYKALIMLPDNMAGRRDLGIIRIVDPLHLKAADAVAYKESGAYYVEPVGQVEADGRQVSLVTGSAKDPSTSRYPVAMSQIEGLLIGRIPGIGSWMLYLLTPSGMLAFLMFPCLSFFFLNSIQFSQSGEPKPILIEQAQTRG